MNNEFPQWLAEQKYSDATQTAQLWRVKKVEEAYGDLQQSFREGTYDTIIENLTYTVSDERANKPNPSKMRFEGSIKGNLQSYRDAVLRYKKFLSDPSFESALLRTGASDLVHAAESIGMEADVQRLQRFTFERDLQAALRGNITSLEPGLKIIDDGAERGVASGFIDITCEDGKGLVVIELKAGMADTRAIGQILGYMGDLQEEESRPVRGILIAQDFDKRTRSASKVVTTLSLRKYAIEFTFTPA